MNDYVTQQEGEDSHQEPATGNDDTQQETQQYDVVAGRCSDLLPESPPILQMCMAQLMKFRDIHRLSLNAISDIIDFTKTLHIHYVSQVQAEIRNEYESVPLPDVQQLLNCADVNYPLEGIETGQHLQTHMTRDLYYVVSSFHVISFT